MSDARQQLTVTVTGVHLDVHAEQLYGLRREVGESDDALRGRCLAKWHEINDRLLREAEEYKATPNASNGGVT